MDDFTKAWRNSTLSLDLTILFFCYRLFEVHALLSKRAASQVGISFHHTTAKWRHYLHPVREDLSRLDATSSRLSSWFLHVIFCHQWNGSFSWEDRGNHPFTTANHVSRKVHKSFVLTVHSKSKFHEAWILEISIIASVSPRAQGGGAESTRCIIFDLQVLWSWKLVQMFSIMKQTSWKKKKFMTSSKNRWRHPQISTCWKIGEKYGLQNMMSEPNGLRY